VPVQEQAMKIQGIKRDIISLLLRMGQDSHPNEFVALLLERDGVIDEVNLLPGTVVREDSASLIYDMMPLDTHVAGSAHSHPSGPIRPSDADLRFFPRTGKYHLIIGYPYRKTDWQCFTADGEPHELEVIA
jgi:proteasome lid subunit RPN8/RPN11